MKLIELNRNPSNRQLRQFGLIAAVAVPPIAWLWAAKFFAEGNVVRVVAAAAAIGALAGLTSLWKPQWLKPVFIGLSLITFPIGMVVGEVILAAIYFLMFTPISMFFRLIGRDPLRKRPAPSSASYWEANPLAEREPATYFRQF